MPLSFHVLPHLLHFKQPAGTSRGVYRTRQSWFLLLWNTDQPLRIGIGECAPLPDLSSDALPDYEKVLTDFCRKFCAIANNRSAEKTENILLDSPLTAMGRRYPSILFGLETALQHLHAGSFALWNTPFSRGETGITINGLVWMGKKEQMLQQVEQKMERGFRCIKLKIGAIDFDEELSLIRHIRSRFSPEQTEIRVDANGAFSPENAMEKLHRLAAFHLHSIEQPIRAGQWAAMAALVAETPIPIALDEELIGINDPKEKQRLLDTIRPHYIILKPSLHGGIHGCAEWIAEAESRSIGWWITSALESNIGLNAIAQWCASLHAFLPQGLGTGALFTDNLELPLSVEGDRLWNKWPKDRNNSAFCTDRNRQTLTLNGIPYSKALAGTLADTKLTDPTTSEWERDLYGFLLEWWDDSPTLSVHTSGSTGTPKKIIVEKEQMMQSAITTCSALKLHRRDKALLCLPVRYIAGKMMVVRALVAGLDLYAIAPDGHPLATIPNEWSFDFVAMVPLQVFNSLQNERTELNAIKNGIIGGAAIDPALEKEVVLLPNAWYSTYGMTETLSHIALRRLNGLKRTESYCPVQQVTVSLSTEKTLVIDAPSICSTTVVTNDIARILSDGSFEILGRKDNVINSGGIKLQPEQLEKKLAGVLNDPFCITSLSDPKLGERAVLLIESKQISQAAIMDKIALHLSIYEMPKQILPIDRLPLTPNGKIDRKACRLSAQTIDSQKH
jgi:o-succinylbenzoate synthase